ncbi:MAG: Rid family hydrolase [Actinomycetota bacterium]|nr:Rid family hydrolase [Actinomycetota bacterium]
MPNGRRISSGSPYESRLGFSRALRIPAQRRRLWRRQRPGSGDRVLVAGTAPIWPGGWCDPDSEAQARRCFEIVLAALAEAGAGPQHVVRTRMYLIDAADADAVGRTHGEIFAGIRPVATMVVVAALLDPRWRVEVEAEAVLD